MAISMRYSNAKISFGYRADEFFGAKDGGSRAQKTTISASMAHLLRSALGSVVSSI
jgi:hypothetical protein